MSINHPALRSFKTSGGMFDVEPCEMDLNIGRRGKRVNPDLRAHGTNSLHPFSVIGVQKDYRGVKCYRILYEGVGDAFGSVLDPQEAFKWIS